MPGSATLPAADVVAMGQDLDFAIAALPLSTGSLVFMYQATVDGDAAVGVPATNSIAPRWAGTPGPTARLPAAAAATTARAGYG